MKAALQKAWGYQGDNMLSEFAIEQHDDVAWKVFYVVAPDGLCYWFGERQAGRPQSTG